MTHQGRYCDASRVAVERVDQWHRAWPKVLDFIDRHGRRDHLHIDADGWLSARQAVLAAFNDHQEVVGHAVFHVEPIATRIEEHPAVAARLDAVDIDPSVDPELRELLISEARQQARFLNCIRLDGFEA
jgi:hypothetical protein